MSITRRNDMSAMEFGKIPPQNREAEEALLGSLLIEEAGLEDIADAITSDMFYVNAHQIIFQAIFNLYQKNNGGVDLITVTAELKRMGKLEEVGGVYYISQLTNKIGTAANVEHYSFIVRQHYLSRRIITFGTDAVRKAYEDDTDIFDLLDDVGRGLSDITDSIKSNTTTDMVKAVTAELLEIDARMAMAADGKVLGVPSGFQELDLTIGGWQKTDLIIIAARPSMGKTALVLCLARNADKLGNVPVAFFSLEMSTSQLTSRLMSSECEINSTFLRSGRLTKEEYGKLTSNLDELLNSKLYIDDTPALSIIELKARARRMKQRYGIGLIVIDYLHLMSGTGKNKEGNREQEISNISRGLKALAKELDVPVIALSQLSRATETRGGEKKPQLSDLRESGAIEQDADIVAFLYRGEYYGLTVDADGEQCKGMGEIIIAKNRNGACKTVKVQFKPEFVKFTDIEYQSENPVYVEIKRELPTANEPEPQAGTKRLISMSEAIGREERRTGGDDYVPF